MLKRSLIVCVLEKSLNFLLTQIVLCERQGTILPRDRKMLKRELNSEIVFFFQVSFIKILIILF